MRRAQAQTISFPVIDSADQTVRKSVTFLAGEVQISKDGGAFANVGTLPTELGSTGCYILPLTAAETDANWLHIRITKTGIMPGDICGATSGHPSGMVVDDAANSATSFVTNLASAVDEFWRFAGVVFTSGSLQGQIREIESYDGATKTITLAAALTAEPAAGDRFDLVNI